MQVSFIKTRLYNCNYVIRGSSIEQKIMGQRVKYVGRTDDEQLHVEYLYLLFQLLPELKSQKYNTLYSNRLPDWFPDFQTQFMFIHKFLSSFGLNSSDVSECSDLVLLVLSAAFDIVDHKILIRKQWAGTLDWFCLFLFQSVSSKTCFPYMWSSSGFCPGTYIIFTIHA